MKTPIAALSLCLAATARVATAQAPQRLPAAVTADRASNTVTVQSDRKVPVTVYLEYGLFDRRLGTVRAGQTETLSLPTWAVGTRTSVQLFVHPEGEGDDLATQMLTLQPPGRLGILVPPEGGMLAAMEQMTAAIPPEELADATLTVENPRDRAVTVFAEQGNFDARLGEVPAGASATLRFPKSVVLPDRSIQIFVHPSGGADLASESLRVSRGEHLGLRVPPR